jgi:hypothetical protein
MHMKIDEKVLRRLTIFVACAIASSTASSALANQPGRGSDKDIRSAEGAALTNAQYEKNIRSTSQSVTAAQDASDALGNRQLPGRGKPTGITSARGAAVQNREKAAAQAATAQAKGVSSASTTNETKSADPNPGGMMSHFPPSQ